MKSTGRHIACATIGLGIAAPIIFGGVELRRAERYGIAAENALRADNLASRMQSQLNLRLGLLRHVSQSMSSFLSEGYQEVFLRQAQQIASTFTEFQSVLYINVDGYVQIAYPAAGNERVAGLNVFESEDTSSAAREAATRGEPAATPLIDLAPGERGFMAFFPVADGALVAGAFALKPLMEAALPHELASRTELSFIDPSQSTPVDAMRLERTISVLGRDLTISTSPSPQIMLRLGVSSRTMIVFGILLAILSGFVVHEMLSHRDRAFVHEAHERALLSAVSDHVVRIDRSGLVLAYHRSSDAPPLPLAEGTKALFPNELWQAMSDCMRESRTLDLEVTLYERWFQARVAPDSQGSLVCFRDVTDQINAETERNLLSSLVTSSSQLAAVARANGAIEYLNPAGCRMLGIPSGRGHRIWEFVQLSADVSRPLRTRESWSGRVNLASAVGEMLPVQLTTFHIPTKSAPQLGVIAVDVSESVRLEKQLVHAGKLEAVGSLAAGVAHDFNNALSVFKTGVELLESTEGIPAEAMEDIALMKSAADSASSVAAQLLTLSKPSVNLGRRCEVDKTLDMSAKMLNRMIREDITIHWDLQAPRASIQCDSGALQQVILNLVLNARDAIQGSGTIRILTRRFDRWVEIEVADNGCGVSKEDQSRVFEPFYTTKPPGSGTGLGLSMVSRIVHAIQGQVTFESEEDVGTTIRLQLPEVAEALETLDSARAPPGPTRTACVVLADDDPKLRTLLRRALERAGHSVLEASDGLEAVALLESQTPVDLVLADIGMPRMGGAELAFWASREHPSIRFLLMTGHPSAELAENPGVDLLLKPVDPTFILGQIERKLGFGLTSTTEEASQGRA